jgi:hypothetical protein
MPHESCDLHGGHLDQDNGLLDVLPIPGLERLQHLQIIVEIADGWQRGAEQFAIRTTACLSSPALHEWGCTALHPQGLWVVPLRAPHTNPRPYVTQRGPRPAPTPIAARKQSVARACSRLEALSTFTDRAERLDMSWGGAWSSKSTGATLHNRPQHTSTTRTHANSRPLRLP